MKNVVFYGAGDFAKRFLMEPTIDFIIKGVVDKNYERIGRLAGYKVEAPTKLKEYEYDQVIITLNDLKSGNEMHIFDIYNELKDMGIPEEKIILQSFKSQEHHIYRYPRMVFLKELSECMKREGVHGSVAECGVYRGWFSSMINEFFSDETLWLFDTFEGFDAKDVEMDVASAKSAINGGKYDRFKNTSMDIVKMRCSHRDKLVFKQGRVPETFDGVNDEFCFVNLDMDLYVPQLAALNFFNERMVKGGVILVHDYYNETFSGTKKAVDEFLEKTGDVRMMPIGDGMSVALLY